MLNLPITQLKGVGEQRQKLFAKVGIHSIHDLMTYFPREYEDRRKVTLIKDLEVGQKVTIKGRICTVPQNVRKGKMIMTRTKLMDESGMIFAVWFGQAYMRNNMRLGEEYYFTGRIQFKYGQMQLNSPDIVPVNAGQATSILPLYPLTYKLNQKIVRQMTKQVLSEYLRMQEEFIPEHVLSAYDLQEYQTAIEQVHFPDDYESLHKAKRRIIFEEFFVLQVGLRQLKNIVAETKEGCILKDVEEEKELLKALPFKLTKAQQKVYDEIREDLSSKRLMNRLVQGDVGSGKTIIALLALLRTVKNGFQGVLMAPTEVLAKQHYEGAIELLKTFGINIALLVGSVTKKNKEKIYQGLATGDIDMVIGTHAIIEDKVLFNNLGLVITDEQHRFGVRQRTALSDKNGQANILVMTATPIPRTLALILYGDMDVSVIDELPPGRQVIKTYSVKTTYHDRIYDFIKKEVDQGRQAYIICPMVEEGDNNDLKAVVQYTEYLQKEIFNDYAITYLHGKQKAKEKNRILGDFAEGKTQILVSTTVVEVGVNVPNATVMLIENAERFGLAQIHQLRGRVGRGKHQSYCVLVTDAKNDVTKKRMKIMTESNDGFKLSEVDLQVRGPGDVFGLMQHGLPNFKVANIYEHMDILKEAGEVAKNIVDLDPRLEWKEHEKLKNHIDYYFNQANSYLTL